MKKAVRKKPNKPIVTTYRYDGRDLHNILDVRATELQQALEVDI